MICTNKYSNQTISTQQQQNAQEQDMKGHVSNPVNSMKKKKSRAHEGENKFKPNIANIQV